MSRFRCTAMNKGRDVSLLKKWVVVPVGLCTTFFGSATVFADEQVIEEIIVTARQQAETLQDVPVTIAAFTEADLDRYNITNLVDAAKMVPNMVIAQQGSGNGSSLRLRGIGSSFISAAFDHSVAINLDGVVVNRGRFIHNSYMDMGQLEVLKGPQSLYFGKSATAGVVSITTNDPGDEFEFQLLGGVETEHEGLYTEMVISAPITDTFGARLAVGYVDNDELIKNVSKGRDPQAAINGAEDWFGDESLNTRLTLVWKPTDTFTAKLKYSYTEFESDGGVSYAEEICPEGTTQPTAIPSAAAPFRTYQSVDDCKLNGNSSKIYLDPNLRAGLVEGYSDGVAGLEQETDFASLRMDWDFTESMTLTAVTGYVDLDHWELDDYSYGAGVFGGLHNNVYESLSQEVRLATAFEDSPINFQLGLFWQEIEQEFDAYQYAFNLPVIPYSFGDLLADLSDQPPMTPPDGSLNYAQFIDNVAATTGQPILFPVDASDGIVGPDPFTGNAFDYQKTHFLDTDVLSAFLAVYWDLTDQLELTFGARYTEEEKDGYILIPYLHGGAGLFGFGAPPRIDGLEFDDENTSPEVALNYYINDNISVFAAYKEAFKSGGIDNSALPTAALNPAVNGGDFSFLEYQSEESDGWEIGTKANLMDGALRVNATIYSYEYSDLQVQLFDSTNIQFETFNASALEAQGAEMDFTYLTDFEGLSLRGAWAFNEVEYTDDFINATGENLKGLDGAGNAEVSGYIGFTLDREFTDGWRFSFSMDARYSDDYSITVTRNPLKQDSFWITDAALSIYSADNRHEFSLIGRNIGDEIYAVTAGAIPGRLPLNNTGANSLDQAATTMLGRSISVQYRFTM